MIVLVAAATFALVAVWAGAGGRALRDLVLRNQTTSRPGSGGGSAILDHSHSD
jgi:hypothetical protein